MDEFAIQELRAKLKRRAIIADVLFGASVLTGVIVFAYSWGIV